MDTTRPRLLPRLRTAAWSAAFAAWAALLPAAAEPPRVLASIAPVHSLLAQVMAGVAEPTLLIGPDVEPHEHALRPSEARALNLADLVVWVGPGMESFLDKPLRSLSGRGRVLTLASAPGMRLLPARAGDDAGGHGASAPPATSLVAAIDPHLWLDPANARRIVALAAQALTELDPARGDDYRRNAAAAEVELLGLEARLRARLAAVAGRPFLQFHDAFQYFEAAFGLSGAGFVTVQPGLPPGAGRVRQLRARLTAGNVACVFTEPQFEPRLVEVLVQGTGARTGVIDDLGSGIAPGPGLYRILMERNADALVRCLAPGGG